MSAARETVADPRDHSKLPGYEPRDVVVFSRCVTIAAVFVLGSAAVFSWSSVLESASWMLPWLLLVTAAELLPVMYMHEVNLTLSMPLLLAAGMTLGPVPAGLLGFLGSWDQRLVRGQISWTRDFFNRGQIALSCFAGALAFHALGGSIDRWPRAILPCLVAVGIDVIINVSLVSLVAPAHLPGAVHLAGQGSRAGLPPSFHCYLLGIGSARAAYGYGCPSFWRRGPRSRLGAHPYG